MRALLVAGAGALVAENAYPKPSRNAIGAGTLAKPNYAFAKRQRDLAKKQKKEAKRLRKTQPEPGTSTSATPEEPPADEKTGS